MLLGAVAYACRDATVHRCPVCTEPVSKYRCIGVYLPPTGKAHVRCKRCVQCGKAVVLAPWPGAPPGRPWHDRCWQDHCSLVCSSARHWVQWCEAQGPGLFETELVHMFAAAVENGADPDVVGLLHTHPDLYTVKITGKGGLTLMHLAARAGNVRVLRFMQEQVPPLPHVMCRVASAACACDLASGCRHRCVCVCVCVVGEGQGSLTAALCYCAFVSARLDDCIQYLHTYISCLRRD